jgi:mycothiol synthase
MPVRAVPPSEFREIRDTVALIEKAASTERGYPSLNEAVWRDLDVAAPESAGFLFDDTAYAHIARSDNFAPRHWALGVSGGDTEARHAIVTAALAHVRAHGGGLVVWWVLDAGTDDDAQLGALGFHRDRDLYEMRVPLPLDASAKWPPGIEVRAFQPGRDERAWLDVNNRAFANHVEQGGWIEETLARRMGEPWFDPSLFLLAFDGDGLAGFNWLKIHEAHGRDPQLGEIFVIGVDPRMQGSGLGRALAIEGMHTVSERGVATGSLFVAAENTGALKLYESLGFTVHRVDRAYEHNVEAS